MYISIESPRLMTRQVFHISVFPKSSDTKIPVLELDSKGGLRGSTFKVNKTNAT